jgi:ABC-2 type transport system permease protein
MTQTERAVSFTAAVKDFGEVRAVDGGVANMVCNLGLSVVGGLWFPLSLFPGRLRSVSAYTPTNRFAQLGTSVADGWAPALGAVAVLTGRLLAFGSYAVVSYRRAARTA